MQFGLFAVRCEVEDKFGYQLGSHTVIGKLQDLVTEEGRCLAHLDQVADFHRFGWFGSRSVNPDLVSGAGISCLASGLVNPNRPKKLIYPDTVHFSPKT